MKHVTSAIQSFHQIATAPCISKKSNDGKQKLGQLLSGIPMFNANDIAEIQNSFIGQGQFGKVRIVTLKKLSVVVACKNLNDQLSSKNDVLAELITGLTLSGGRHFPFVYGLLNNFSILMEYFRNVALNEPKAAPNLWTWVKGKPSAKDLQTKLCYVLDAVIYMHSFKILHNDLKADNFIYSEECVKLVDFGKGESNINFSSQSISYTTR